MKTIFDSDCRTDLVRRLDGFSSDNKPRWGRMDSGRMLAHLCDSVRMALGDLPVRSKGGPLRFAPIRHAIIYWFPFPKGAPTAPELITRAPEDHSREIAELKSLIDRIGAQSAANEWPDHPAFGHMSARDWGALTHKHIDHHLRQFGA